MKIDKSKENGFSLIELLAVSAIGSGIAAFFIKSGLEQQEQTKIVNFIEESYSIIEAIDHRIAIDGYSPSLWGSSNWNDESQIVNNLIKKELTSKFLSSCPGGNWSPQINDEKNTKLLDCNLWNNRAQGGEKITGKMHTDNAGFIQKIELIISYDDSTMFSEKFLNLKYAINKLKGTKTKEISGLHTVDFVSISTGNYINSKGCIDNFNNCGIKMAFERNGGGEYIRSDGSNSMILSNLSFVDTKGNSPLKCVRWKMDGSGVWSRTADEECGIGIYDNAPIAVDTLAETGTFTNILLEKKCKLYEWNGTNVVESIKVTPCGISNDGTEVYQVAENTVGFKGIFDQLFVENFKATNSTIESLIATNANIKTLDSETGNFKDLNVTTEANIKLADIKSIVTEELNADVINVKNLFVSKDTTFNGIVNFNEEVNFNAIANFNQDAYFNDINASDIDVSGTLKATSVNSENITAEQGNIKNISSERIYASDNVTSPVGNFDNIDNEIDTLKNNISKLMSDVGITITNNQKNACNSKSSTYVSQRNASCPSGYYGTAKKNKYKDWYWSGSSCTYKYTYHTSTSGCKKRSGGGNGACGANGCGNGGRGSGGGGGA